MHWTVTDPESAIISTTGCEPAIQVNGPNTRTTRTCSATSDGGTTTVTTKSLKIDATPGRYGQLLGKSTFVVGS